MTKKLTSRRDGYVVRPKKKANPTISSGQADERWQKREFDHGPFDRLAEGMARSLVEKSVASFRGFMDELLGVARLIEGKQKPSEKLPPGK